MHTIWNDMQSDIKKQSGGKRLHPDLPKNRRPIWTTSLTVGDEDGPTFGQTLVGDDGK